MCAQISVWPGSGSAANGSTPFGFYDTDTEFQTEAPQFAKWAAYQLGYPIISVELQDLNFYAAFEIAITEYSSQVNQFQIRDNLLHLQGQSTGSVITQKNVTPTLGRTIFIAKQYGTEVGAGGNVDWRHDFITVNTGSQVYDLNDSFAEVSHSGAAIEIKRVFHETTPAITRYFDPYAGTGAGSYNMMDSFGWGNMSPAVQFMMMPFYADFLRIQAIEFNDQIRKSAYSFELINNKLRIFPKPTSKFRVYFDYILKSDRDNSLITPYGGTVNTISDYSNVPYENMTYSYINGVGKQWIRRYALAESKEILGRVRGKYDNIPIPNAETSLDGVSLISEAQTEKEALIAELRETLESTSRRNLMSSEQEEAEALQAKLQKIPLAVYIG